MLNAGKHSAEKQFYLFVVAQNRDGEQEKACGFRLRGVFMCQGVHTARFKAGAVLKRDAGFFFPLELIYTVTFIHIQCYHLNGINGFGLNGIRWLAGTNAYDPLILRKYRD